MDIRLSEASQVGNVSTLYTMIRENANLLHQFEEPSFCTTPLHIAAENGQIEFATIVMYLKPSFASKLDQSLFTPMHLALKEDQTEMVLWLLRLDSELVRVKGKDGFTPFLYAVRQGKVDILIAFLKVCPNCIKDINIRGENALHIALNYNCFEAFKLLLGWVRRSTHPNSDTWEKEFSKGKDKEGNTVLHTAASMMNHDAIQFLTKYYPRQRKVKNLEDLTPLEILQNHDAQGQEQARDIKSQKLLSLKAKVYRDISKISEDLKEEVSKAENFRTFITRQRMKLDGSTRNAMLIVNVLVITIIIFQGVYTPAGGVWPTDSNSMTTSPICNITCTNNTLSCSCNVSRNDTKLISSTITNTPRPATSVMDKDVSFLTWLLNTCTIILACALTSYLLRPGYTDKL